MSSYLYFISLNFSIASKLLLQNINQLIFEVYTQWFLNFSAFIVVLWIRSKACNVINKSSDAIICSFCIPNLLFLLYFLFGLHRNFFFFYHLIYHPLNHSSFKLSSELGLSISLNPLIRNRTRTFYFII
jgi:hypothetical protein